MSGYILCQVEKAKTPYYIENISVNIYSIEELCFYLRHNIYLLDETIINVELCHWIRDELELRRVMMFCNMKNTVRRLGDRASVLLIHNFN